MGGERYGLDATRGARRATVITPNDSTVFPETRGVYIGTAGAITVMHAEDTVATTYPTTIAGYVYPWHITQVLATGTVAADIRGQY